MTEATQRLKSELAQLPSADRAELAHFLLHSLDSTNDDADDVEAAWEAELNHRLTDIQAGTAMGEPAAQVFAELRRKYS